MNDYLQLTKTIQDQLLISQKIKRRPLSVIFPELKKPIIKTRRLKQRAKNRLDFSLSKKIHYWFLPNVIFRHQSLLRRKLGSSDPRLQEQKIVNLQQAAKKLNGLIIQPGQTFSFWHAIGKPSYKKGFVNGMLLSDGQVTEGAGGGLCQMSNLLYWIFLHAPVEIIERHHHSRDVFPDSGRVLPFGSGATVYYNYIDLKIKNISNQPLQLKIWLTDKHLKGHILSDQSCDYKFHVKEKNHCFIEKNQQYYRFNEIWREIHLAGNIIHQEHITTNFAPVLYQIDYQYLNQNNYLRLALA
jgi:vancomycin resistance protein VanW